MEWIAGKPKELERGMEIHLLNGQTLLIGDLTDGGFGCSFCEPLSDDFMGQIIKWRWVSHEYERK